MIALLSGEIAYKSIDHVVLDVGGVGYRVLIPLSTFYSLPDHGKVRLHIHTHVREDALHLYGFVAPEEKDLFILLLGVSGIGPRLAVNILSHCPAEQLRRALAGSDIKGLSSLPGIGRKTAERLVLELREKIGKMNPGLLPGPSGPAGPPSAPLDDALSALVNLGYKETLARKTLENLEVPPGTSVEDILKGALKILVR